MKTTKKKAVKKPAKGQNSAPKKTKENVRGKVASAPLVDYYHVDIRQDDGTYVVHPTYQSVEKDIADLGVETLKGIGLAGRLVHFDGTPDGRVVETWASIADVEKALATEVPQTTQTD